MWLFSANTLEQTCQTVNAKESGICPAASAEAQKAVNALVDNRRPPAVRRSINAGDVLRTQRAAFCRHALDADTVTASDLLLLILYRSLPDSWLVIHNKNYLLYPRFKSQCTSQIIGIIWRCLNNLSASPRIDIPDTTPFIAHFTKIVIGLACASSAILVAESCINIDAPSRAIGRMAANGLKQTVSEELLRNGTLTDN